MSSNVSTVASALDTVNKMLEHWSKTEPDKPAFIFRSPATEPNPRLVLTRRHIFTLSSAYAAILRREGVRQGDVVCNTLPNSPERLLTDLGVMLAGAVAMNGTFFLADGADFVEAVRKGRCVAVIGDPNIKSSPLSVLQKRLAYSVGTTVHCPDVPCLHLLLSVDCRADQDGHSPLLQQLWEGKESFVADVRPTDPAYVFTTSGSTGFSKLVLKSHSEYLLVGETAYHLMGLRPDDVVFYEDLLGWMVGAPCDFVARGFTRVMLTETGTPPSDYIRFGWEIITNEACTAALVPPVEADMTLARNDLWEDLHPKLRLIITCGQPVRKHYLDLIGKVTESVVICYGSTETGPLTQKVVDATTKPDYEDGNNGFPLPAVEIKIVDNDEREVLEVGKTGEILVRGPNVFKQYLDADKDVVKDAFTPDGWFRMSDIGYKNSKGELHIVCRKSNAIIYGPFVLYPGWLESRLVRCPGVQSVIIVPVPDPVKHQELCACVVRKPGVKVTAEEICEFSRTLYIDSAAEEAAVPKYILFYDVYPKTVTGKTDRRAILQSALRSLGMGSQDNAVVTENIE